MSTVGGGGGGSVSCSDLVRTANRDNGPMSDRVVPCTPTTLSTPTVQPRPPVRPIVYQVHSRRSSEEGLQDDVHSRGVWSRSRVGTCSPFPCVCHLVWNQYVPRV